MSAEAIFERIKSDLGDEWDEIEELGKDELERAARDLADLGERALAGEDVAADMRHVKARIANWSFVGASKAEAALQRVVVVIGEFLGGVLRGAVGL